MKSSKYRNQEQYETAHFRSGRFYSIENEWYFRVREQQDQGPFPSKEVAEDKLKTYLDDFEYFKSKKSKFDLSKLKIS